MIELRVLNLIVGMLLLTGVSMAQPCEDRRLICSAQRQAESTPIFEQFL